MKMNGSRFARALRLVVACAAIAACGGDDAPAIADTTAADEAQTASMEPPVADAPAGEAETAPAPTSQLVVIAYGSGGGPSSVRLALTDPMSRTTGVTEAGGAARDGIPSSRYAVAEVEGAAGETAPVVTVDGPASGSWIVQVSSESGGRYALDVRAVHEDGRATRGQAPDSLAAGGSRRWRITFDASDPSVFRLDPAP